MSLFPIESSNTEIAFLMGPLIASGICNNYGFSDAQGLTDKLLTTLPNTGDSATIVYYFAREDWPTLVEKFTRIDNGFYVQTIGE